MAIHILKEDVKFAMSIITTPFGSQKETPFGVRSIELIDTKGKDVIVFGATQKKGIQRFTIYRYISFSRFSIQSRIYYSPTNFRDI